MLPALARAGQRTAFPAWPPNKDVGRAPGNRYDGAMSYPWRGGRSVGELMDTADGNLAPQRGWWSRNWKWMVPVGCLGMLASCGCLFAIIGGAVYGSFKNTGAYTEAVAIATSDSEVQATLGQKIDTGFPMGSVKSTNGRTRADLTISLDGDKADGTLRVKGADTGSGWNYSVLQVEVPGRPPIDLRDKVGGGTRELAPPTPDAPPVQDEPMDDAFPPANEGEQEQEQGGDADINL